MNWNVKIMNIKESDKKTIFLTGSKNNKERE